jgi:hypothetical protein
MFDHVEYRTDQEDANVVSLFAAEIKVGLRFARKPQLKMALKLYRACVFLSLRGQINSRVGATVGCLFLSEDSFKARCCEKFRRRAIALPPIILPCPERGLSRSRLITMRTSRHPRAY